MRWPFSKMQGAGNDFVILDARTTQALPSVDSIRRMADRHFGIGFDQLLVIDAPKSAQAVASYRIFNQDGSVAGQCGNGARCIAHWLAHNNVISESAFYMDSPAGLIGVVRLAQQQYQLNMGRPQFNPVHIPLLVAEQALRYPILLESQTLQFSALSMGNPHAVVVVDDCHAVPVTRWGRCIQESGLFPEGVNVGFAHKVSRDALCLRVYERGVGETLACGSGACAAAVSLMQQGLVARKVDVHLPGGTLSIAWPDDAAEVQMSGPAVMVFQGEWIDD